MMYDGKTTIGAFLDAAAAKQPTPGGGSVTALVGALAASMGEMVVNYTVDKKAYVAHREELTAAQEENRGNSALRTVAMAVRAELAAAKEWAAAETG